MYIVFKNTEYTSQKIHRIYIIKINHLVLFWEIMPANHENNTEM